MINAPMTQLDVTFDRPLFPNPSPNLANWAVRYNNVARTVVGGDVAGSVVELLLTAGGADVDIDRVNFDPPPDDVIDLDTLEPAAAFTDFPITM